MQTPSQKNQNKRSGFFNRRRQSHLHRTRNMVRSKQYRTLPSHKETNQSQNQNNNTSQSTKQTCRIWNSRMPHVNICLTHLSTPSVRKIAWPLLYVFGPQVPPWTTWVVSLSSTRSNRECIGWKVQNAIVRYAKVPSLCFVDVRSRRAYPQNR